MQNTEEIKEYSEITKGRIPRTGREEASLENAMIMM